MPTRVPSTFTSSRFTMMVVCGFWSGIRVNAVSAFMVLAGRWGACGAVRPGSAPCPCLHAGRTRPAWPVGWNSWRQVHDDTRSAELWAPDGAAGSRRLGRSRQAECARGSKREAQREGAYGTRERSSAEMWVVDRNRLTLMVPRCLRGAALYRLRHG